MLLSHQHDCHHHHINNFIILILILILITIIIINLIIMLTKEDRFQMNIVQSKYKYPLHHPRLPQMSARLLSIVPGKPMYTSTKESRPQCGNSCYQKTFRGWHTQYTQSRSPFSGPQDPQIVYYLAVPSLRDAMGI